MSLGRDEETFFGAVLDLHERYQLLPALERAGIVPDDNRTYARSAVVEALRADEGATGGARAAVHCGSGRRGGGELTEVWLCLRRETLEPFDCPDNVLSRRVGRNGDTDSKKKGGCETLKLPKLKTRSTPAAPKKSGDSSNNNKGSDKGSSSSSNNDNSKASAARSGFGSAGDAVVTLEKSL